jgi:hypothetical protein
VRDYHPEFSAQLDAELDFDLFGCVGEPTQAGDRGARHGLHPSESRLEGLARASRYFCGVIPAAQTAPNVSGGASILDLDDH